MFENVNIDIKLPKNNEEYIKVSVLNTLTGNKVKYYLESITDDCLTINTEEEKYMFLSDLLQSIELNKGCFMRLDNLSDIFDKYEDYLDFVKTVSKDILSNTVAKSKYLKVEFCVDNDGDFPLDILRDRYVDSFFDLFGDCIIVSLFETRGNYIDELVDLVFDIAKCLDDIKNSENLYIYAEDSLNEFYNSLIHVFLHEKNISSMDYSCEFGNHSFILKTYFMKPVKVRGSEESLYI